MDIHGLEDMVIINTQHFPEGTQCIPALMDMFQIITDGVVYNADDE